MSEEVPDFDITLITGRIVRVRNSTATLDSLGNVMVLNGHVLSVNDDKTGNAVTISGQHIVCIDYIGRSRL